MESKLQKQNVILNGGKTFPWSAAEVNKLKTQLEQDAHFFSI